VSAVCGDVADEEEDEEEEDATALVEGVICSAAAAGLAAGSGFRCCVQFLGFPGCVTPHLGFSGTLESLRGPAMGGRKGDKEMAMGGKEEKGDQRGDKEMGKEMIKEAIKR
jgi:hypothetical protein